MAERSYTVIGTGALGGYYGALLHHAGLDVRFLLHSDFDHVRVHGLKVESKQGDLSIGEPKIFARAADLAVSDVVLVCLKTTSNGLLPELLPAALEAGSIVVMLQNGLGPEDAAAIAAPGHTILGALAFVCSNKVGPGHIRHIDYGGVRVGQFTADGTAAGVTTEVAAVVGDFASAGVECGSEDDLLRARWRKLVWNVPFNGLCVVARGTTDVVMANPRMRVRAEALMQEVVAASEACGKPVGRQFAELMMVHTEAMAPYKPSMLLDFERNAPLELEAIYENPLRAAKQAGVECPRISELLEELRG